VDANQRWDNAPLILVMAQVQFDDNEVVEEKFGQIQQELSKEGFSGAQITQMQDAIIEFGQDGVAQSKMTPLEVRQIFDTSVSQVFTITKRDFTLSQSNYTTFENFYKCFSKGLKIVNEIVGVKPLRRLGLRYIDLLQAEENLSLNMQIAEELHGFQINDQDGREVFSTAPSKKDGSRLVFKAIQGVTLANHLGPIVGQIPIIPRLKNPINTIESLVFDIDVSEIWQIVTPHRPTTESFEKLRDFHERAAEVFKSSLSQKGFEHYKGR
jgi:uncharacterized protein (TIGR04255 family)